LAATAQDPKWVIRDRVANGKSGHVRYAFE
jgi:hypothetical protein